MPQTAEMSIKLSKEDLKTIKENVSSEEQYDIDEVEAMGAVRLFIDSRVTEAEQVVRKKCKISMIHCHANGVLAMLKGLMTFDQQDIAYALSALRNSIDATSYLRKEQSFVSSFAGMFTGGGQKSKLALIKSMSRHEKMAEVTFAECYLLRAILSILTEADFVTFLKEGLAIRQAYNIYKSCYKFLRKLYNAEGTEGLLKNNITPSFITCVYLGIGGFNLMLSILPAKVLRIFEFIGFSGIVSLNAGNREFGMKCLALGADWPFEELQSPLKVPLPKSAKNIAINFFSDEIPKETGIGTRKFMCDIMLHMYHVLFSSMIQLPGCNIPLATKMIDAAIVEHPNSFLYLLIRAKISQSERSLERGIAELDKVISVQKDWRQLAHLCFWDLGISNAALGNYETAADYFDILYKENEWSKSIYLYFRAVLLYAADSIKYKDIISDLMKKIPDHLKKVAGKSVPLEKFVARKARKYFLQEERLEFPVLELIYMWNGFDLIPDNSLLTLQNDLEKSLSNLDKLQEDGRKEGKEIPYPTFYDDLCLVRFFKGLATRELAIPSSSMLIPEKKLIARQLTEAQSKGLEYAAKQLEFISLQADDIVYDHWILPFCRYELASLHIRTSDYSKARLEYQAALNGGYNDDEAGKLKKKASMETSLHIRVHNAIAKLDFLLSLKGETVAVEEDIDQDSDGDD